MTTKPEKKLRTLDDDQLAAVGGGLTAMEAMLEKLKVSTALDAGFTLADDLLNEALV